MSRKNAGELLVREATDYIEAHSMEKFSLQQMSDALFVNGCYLLRLFKSRTGTTLLAWHNSVRCEKAKELLRHPEMSISEAGEAVGFVSSSHFTHVFHKTTGMTPKEYRSRMNATADKVEGRAG